MPELRTCVVSYVDGDGIVHSVEVTASSKYEAAGLALKAHRSQRFWEGPGLGPIEHTKLVVKVKARVDASYEFKFSEFHDWLEQNPRSPREVALKKRLRELLKS